MIQLGLDPTTDPFRSAPFQISQEGEKVYTGATGANASAYITFDGKVKVNGRNTNGKLGLDRFIEAPVPQIRTSTETITAFTESPNLTGAIEISLGGQFTLAVLTDGSKLLHWVTINMEILEHELRYTEILVVTHDFRIEMQEQIQITYCTLVVTLISKIPIKLYFHCRIPQLFGKKKMQIKR